MQTIFVSLTMSCPFLHEYRTTVLETCRNGIKQVSFCEKRGEGTRMQVTSTAVAGIIDNLRRVFQVVNEYSKRAEKETGLTGPQLWAIKVIYESEAIKVSELARKMYLHPATVVGILDRLESRGLVARTRSTEDRRVVYVDLTELGKDLVKQAPEVVQGVLVRGLEQLPKDELLTIANSLEQLVGIVGAQGVAPKLMLSPCVNAPAEQSDTQYEEGPGQSAPNGQALP